MERHGLRCDAVFEGGGVKGIGLVGALAAVEEAGYTFANIAGTSAGAIVAALLASGYTAAQLKPIMMTLDFTQFTDAPLLGRVPLVGPVVSELVARGLYRGDFFLHWMRRLLADKGVHTFRDLRVPEFADNPRYRYRLRVVTADISRGRKLVLPQDIAEYGQQPDDLDVALAVRMSMSIPFFFMPVRLGRSTIVDGGLLSNFPVDLFDVAGVPEWPTFGFKLVRSGNADPADSVRHPIRGPLSQLAAMFATAMEAHDAYYLKAESFVRTITIDTLDIASTDFALTSQRKTALYESGVAGAQEFLAHWDFEAYKRQFRSGQPIPSRRDQLLPVGA